MRLPASHRTTRAPALRKRGSHSSMTHNHERHARSKRRPMVLPDSEPISGPGSGSVSGGAAVGSRMRMRLTSHERNVPGVMQSHVVGTGIPFAEGPVWCPDGTVIVTSVAEGALYRVWPEQEKTDLVARTRGGANGAALAYDGSILVTQNGGIDYSKLPV